MCCVQLKHLVIFLYLSVFMLFFSYMIELIPCKNYYQLINSAQSLYCLNDFLFIEGFTEKHWISLSVGYLSIQFAVLYTQVCVLYMDVT